MNKGRYFAVILFCLIAVYQSFAEYSPLSVPDSSEIRKGLVNSWFTREYDELISEKPFITENILGEKFQVRVEDLETEFAIVVAPSTDIDIEVHTDAGIETKTAAIFPFDSPGSWVLFRSKEDGKPVRICYYFQADSEVYLQIRPDKNKSLADMKLYNAYPVYGVSLGLPIENFFTLSFAQLYKLTSYFLPWHFFAVEKGMYSANLQMIGEIREHLQTFSYEADAAYDHAGIPVSISSGDRRSEKKDGLLHVDSAGFAKWVVDGLVYASTGSYLNIEPLKRETVLTKTGTLAQAVSEKHNIYFALDWTRNLAAAWLSIVSGKDTLYEETGAEVTINPFASVDTKNGVARNSSYIEGTGYDVLTLKPLMYVLAATEPERMYLGALRQTDGKSPEIVYYNEVVVFFPFFDDRGSFHCVVYHAGIEKTLDEFLLDWEDSFVNLVRLKTSKRFFPQQKK